MKTIENSEQFNAAEKPANIAEIAQKQRYMHLLDKLKQNKSLTKSEIKELAKYERHKTEITSTQVTAKRKLTFKQQKFIDAYNGNIKEAAEEAGLSYNYCRSKLVAKGSIIAAIKNRQETEVRPKTIADRQERQAFWTKMQRDENAEPRDRLKASELLGKSEVDFTEKVQHSGEINNPLANLTPKERLKLLLEE